MRNLVLRTEMLPFLLDQRTHYMSGFHTVARRYLRYFRLNGAYLRYAVPTIERARMGNTLRKYHYEIQKEFEELRKFLPPAPCTLLDIGCGLGCINIFMNRYYSGKVNIHLLDKDGRSKIFYGFSEKAAYYNQLQFTLQFLIDNGVIKENIYLHEIDSDGYPSYARFDLVLSLLSWRFHYPVDTYLKKVSDSLNAGGRIILDIRKGTDEDSQIEHLRGFSSDKRRSQTDANYRSQTLRLCASGILWYHAKVAHVGVVIVRPTSQP